MGKVNKISLSAFIICLINISLLVVLLLPDNMRVIGVSIILSSVTFVVLVRKNRLLTVLAAIIAFINCSVAIYNCILESANAPAWQRNGMLFTSFDIATSKSILITSCIVCIIVGIFLKQAKKVTLQKREYNGLIQMGLIVVLCGVFILGVREVLSKLGSGYSSVMNPLFEYCTVLIMILWLYSKKSVEKFIKIFALCYSAIFFMIGDRSCAMVMLVLVYVLFYAEKRNIWKLALIAVCGILFINAIGYIRKLDDFTLSSVIDFIVQRGVYVDTITWAYYASVTISALNHYVAGAWRFFPGYVLYFLTGIGTTYSGMSAYARNNFAVLYNMGGGIYSSYFYGMGNYLGVVLGAILLGVIIIKVYNSEGKNAAVYQVLLPALSFRWYLYSFSTLFRGIFVLTPIALLACRILSDAMRRRKDAGVRWEVPYE